MATTRLLRTSKALKHVPSPGTPTSSVRTVKCVAKASFVNGENMVSGDGDKRKSTVAVKATVAASPPCVDEQGINSGSLLTDFTNAVVKVLRPIFERKALKLHIIQMLIERVIVDCRFFTLFAVAGSLLGSVLCFVEGCFLVLESYFQYILSLSQKLDQGHIMHLLIEAIDMYLVGTAMLIYGMGTYVTYVKSKNTQEKEPQLPGSNLFGLYSMKKLAAWMEIESVSQAKSRIGHAVLLILQAGVLEKLKSVPLDTSLDLACLAGALLISSACTFLLSKLSTDT